LDDSNDYAGCSRDTKFKPLVLDEIHPADDSSHNLMFSTLTPEIRNQRH
jgi:hypothetical protein